MGVEPLIERYQSQIDGVLSCYDRTIIQGTIPKWCHAGGMTNYFYEHQIRIFGYPKWAEPLRDAIRENMERWPRKTEWRSSLFEARRSSVRRSRCNRGWTNGKMSPGWCAFCRRWSPAGTYKPWHDKKTHKTHLKPDAGKCLRYYVYFIDPDLGLKLKQLRIIPTLLGQPAC